ncbi:MAG: hypothetical protein RI897_2156 [Verrucomicrobiota bacterium]
MNDLELLKSRSSSGDRMIRTPSHHGVVGSSVDGLGVEFAVLNLVILRPWECRSVGSPS